MFSEAARKSGAARGTFAAVRRTFPWLRMFAAALVTAALGAALVDVVHAQAPTHPLAEQVDPKPLDLSGLWTAERWHPYLAGVGIGILSWLAFLLSNRPLGVSTAFANTAGMLEYGLRGRKVKDKPYYRDKVALGINWEWMVVVGVILGAFCSAAVSGSFRWEWTPPLWAEHFGDAAIPRVIVAFIGGGLVGLGARWAGGCTSGHGISGTLQLVVSSWVAVICFFAGGVATAFIIYGLFG